MESTISQIVQFPTLSGFSRAASHIVWCVVHLGKMLPHTMFCSFKTFVAG